MIHYMTLGAVLAAFAAQAGEIDLSKIEVVRARKENAQQKVAADDLVKHLKLICGSEEGVGGFRFVFARPADEPTAQPFTAHAKRVGNAIWFWGDDKGVWRHPCYGSSFAVSQFLEKSLGVRWVCPGDDGIVWHEGVKPTLVGDWRWDWSCPNYVALMRGTDAEWGRRLCYFEKRPFPYRHAFGGWQGKYLKDHPEYFGLNPYGKRGLPEHQARLVKLCLSNPAVVDRIIGDWLEAGTNAYINACPNDGTPGYCFCEGCRALDADLPGENFYVNKTDRYFNFWNRLVGRAREIRPDVKVSTYVYSYYRFPPRRERIVYPDNMIFGWVPCQADDFSGNLAKLREVGMRHFFLRPNYMCYRDKVPRALERFLYDTYHECRAAGGFGFDYDGSYKPILGLEYYLLFRQTAFPKLSFEAICEEYYSQYGALAPVAKVYYERVRARCEGRRSDMFRKMAKTNALDDSELRGFSLGNHAEQDLVDDAALVAAADMSGLSAPERRRWKAFADQVAGFVTAFRTAREEAKKPKEISPAGWRSSFDRPALDGWTKRDNFLEITKETASFDRYSVRCKTEEEPGIGIWRRDVPVTSGAKYSLTYDVKMDEGVGACALRVVCSKPDGKIGTLVRFPAERQGAVWQEAGGTFVVPQGTDRVAIYFQTGAGGEGKSVWVDNIVLRRL